MGRRIKTPKEEPAKVPMKRKVDQKLDRMPQHYRETIPIGSVWTDTTHKRRTLVVIGWDTIRSRVAILSEDSGRITKTRPERFNGNVGGYARRLEDHK